MVSDWVGRDVLELKQNYRVDTHRSDHHDGSYIRSVHKYSVDTSTVPGWYNHLLMRPAVLDIPQTSIRDHPNLIVTAVIAAAVAAVVVVVAAAVVVAVFHEPLHQD